MLYEVITKTTVTMLDLPPAVNVHQLMYAQAPVVQYPVSLHNFTSQSSYPVKVQVVKADNPGKVVFEKVQECEVAPHTYKEVFFDLKIPAGNYNVTASALECSAKTQLGVEKAKGNATS